MIDRVTEKEKRDRERQMETEESDGLCTYHVTLRDRAVAFSDAALS